MSNSISKIYFQTYLTLLDIDVTAEFAEIKEKEWNAENFRFFMAVSVMASLKIEGEQLEVDSYVKHKVLNIEYLPNLIEKPNDLYKAYEFARDHMLSPEKFLEVHAIATHHLLPLSQRGSESGNMVIMEQQTNRIQYQVANSFVVKHEYERFWLEVLELIATPMSIDDVFYFAAFIHLVFVKIHPFNDGNGRTGWLLEKWFLAEMLREKAWYEGSEYYYKNLPQNIDNLAKVGLFYEVLNYDKSTPFLLMLPQSLKV